MGRWQRSMVTCLAAGGVGVALWLTWAICQGPRSPQPHAPCLDHAPSSPTHKPPRDPIQFHLVPRTQRFTNLPPAP
jgi:hypothetical protein